jgi:hypothetical protein
LSSIHKALQQKNRIRGWGQGGEMNQALYAHMNNKRKMKKKKRIELECWWLMPIILAIQ